LKEARLQNCYSSRISQRFLSKNPNFF